YRSLGVRVATLDPLKRSERPYIAELDPAFYGLTESDLDQLYSSTNTYFDSRDTMTLRDMLQALRATYCQTIGYEYMHISNPEAKRWIQERIEPVQGKFEFTAEEKRNILQQLTEAEGLERFLHTKYVGQKRFSLEGGDSFIACMDEAVNHSGAKGVQRMVVAMAHRGRLYTSVNSMGKMPADLFAEVEVKPPDDLTAGDGKSHSGFSSDLSTRG